MFFTDEYAKRLANVRKALNECAVLVAQADHAKSLDSFDAGYEQAWMEAVSALLLSAEERHRVGG